MIRADQHPGNPQWAQRQVRGLPSRWQKRLVNKWQTTRADFDPSILTARGDATRSAAYWLADTVDGLKTVSIPLDASDADICDRAEAMAAYCNSLAEVFRADPAAIADYAQNASCGDSEAFTAYSITEAKKTLLRAMAGTCEANSITPPAGRHLTADGAIARMVDGLWWRRQLRKLHAKAVEGGAISIGYVNKTRDIYVSNESLARRRQQLRRNAAMLENTKAVNENDQEFTLAQLAATGTANKAIRRGELMTRIAGFERIAIDCGHVGLFFTMTCPSRMHKWRTVAGGKVAENKKYDGTTPKEAQEYLSHVWQLIRSKMKREDHAWYGFRIAEPNHDGTPHWHLLVFFDSAAGFAMPAIQNIVRHYALMDSGDEAGADQHRVDFKPMDPAKGTAAGYIAKYVSKNIDGYGVDKDLFGNEILVAAQRVEAWAATWGIRQFQQIGGAPVGPWRELRRVKDLPADAPDHLVEAHRACNKFESEVEGEAVAASWDRYVLAQGGVFVGRDYRIRMATEEAAGTGRYGDPLGERPVGVQTLAFTLHRDGIIPNARVTSVMLLVKSVRHVWEVIRAGARKIDRAIGAAWTRVNNCTPQKAAWMNGMDFSIASGIGNTENCRDEWDFSRIYDDVGQLVSPAGSGSQK